MIVAMIAFTGGYQLVGWAFTVKAAFDFYAASKYALRSLKKEKEKKKMYTEARERFEKSILEIIKKS